MATQEQHRLIIDFSHDGMGHRTTTTFTDRALYEKLKNEGLLSRIRQCFEGMGATINRMATLEAMEVEQG